MEVERHRCGSFCTSVLGTRDVASAAAFYEDLFGWRVEEIPEAPGFRHVLHRDEPVCGLLRVEGEDLWVPHVAVDRLDDTIDAALSLGGTLIERVEIEGVGRLARVRDREGAVVGLWEGPSHDGSHRMGSVGSIWWLEILTNHVAVAREFYGGLFGWEARDTAFEPFDEYVVFERDGRQEGGLLPIGRDWGVSPRWNTIFAVDDADATARRAEQLGGCVHFVHTVPSAGRIAVLGDAREAVFVVRGPV
jgi:predicted enzyme related to lactoylglutathione lyase